MMFSLTPDGGPLALAVGRVDQHAHHGAGARGLAQHAHAEVLQVDVLELRVVVRQRLAQRVVEGADRPVRPRPTRCGACPSFAPSRWPRPAAARRRPCAPRRARGSSRSRRTAGSSRRRGASAARGRRPPPRTCTRGLALLDSIDGRRGSRHRRARGRTPPPSSGSWRRRRSREATTPRRLPTASGRCARRPATPAPRRWRAGPPCA